LPPRVPVPVDLAPKAGVTDLAESFRLKLAPDGKRVDPITRRRAIDRIRRALASGAALKAVLTPDEIELRRQADAMDAADARVEWLVTNARRWRRANEKTLVFVAHRETLEMLRDALSRRAQLASGVFHEELSAARRDTEVALFRAADGPSILVSTEAGGEGRNFEFCHRLVLYDLPWNPATVEQRIGRLDRIGRRLPVDVIYFRPPSGVGAGVVRLFEALGLFGEPMAGLEPQLAHIERAIEEISLDADAQLTDAIAASLLADAKTALTRVHEAAYRQLHRDAYRAELAPAIHARIPADLDALIERFVVNAASRLGFRVEQVRGRRTYAIEFGNEALVDSLPGVPAGTSLLGTFDREHAVENETIDFFSSGHALVEGLLAHFEDDPKGRVARLEVHIAGETGRGIVAIYNDGPRFDVRAFDAEGRERPAWADAFRLRPLRANRMKPSDATEYDWKTLVMMLAPRMGDRLPYSMAAIVVRSS
jgi:ATP-dependent helicase HepA